MSITRLQQARQMYAMGQRVAKTLDGSRPGYGGGADMGTKSGTSKTVLTQVFQVDTKVDLKVERDQQVMVVEAMVVVEIRQLLQIT